MAKRTNLKLMAVTIMAVLIGVGSVRADLTDGLVAHWKLDGNANDSAGSNHGTIYGATPTTGKIDIALSFDGVDDYIDCGNSFASITGSTTKTITAWAKSDVSDQSGRIITLYRHSDSYSAFVIYPRGNDGGNPATWQALYATPGNSYNFIDSEVPVTAGEWAHIALVQNGANVHMYIDGELKNSVSDAAAPTISNPPNAVIGTYMWYGHGPDPSFLGSIDDVRIYDRALSAEEVQLLMHTRPDADDSSLVAYWDFDDGQGEIATDMSGNGNDGAIVGAGWVDSDAPVGICSIEEIVEKNLTDVWNTKLNILEQLYETMAQEEALWEYMDTMFKNRDFGNTSKGDVAKAKQKIHSAIQHEEQAEAAVDQSLDKLGVALDALDIEPPYLE